MLSRRRRSRARILGALAASAFSAVPIYGQTSAIWIGAAGGNWTDPTMWSTNPFYPNKDNPAGASYDATLPLLGTGYTTSLGGTITLDALNNNATLELVGNGAQLLFTGASGLSGTGQVVFTPSTNTNTVIAPAAGNASGLTIGSGITIRTAATNFSDEVIGSASLPLVNNGIISCESANSNLTITGNNWVNAGTIKLSTGVLTLSGTTTTANLGTFNRTGGTLGLTGTLNNTGSTLDLANLGNLVLNGIVTGGNIVSTSNATLTTNGNFALLDGVTLGVDMNCESIFGGNESVFFKNGLTLNGHNVFLNLGDGLQASGTAVQTLGGTGQIIMDALANSGSGLQPTVGGANVTIGPGVTVRTGAFAANTSGNGINVVMSANQGTISAQTQAMVVQVSNSSWSNAGTMKVSAGNMSLNNNWSNTGAISITGGTLSLNGNWSNAGTITGSGGLIQLGGATSMLGSISTTGGSLDITGTYTTAQLRQINATGTSLGVGGETGVLDNTGDTLQLTSATGNFRLNSGTIKGGSITRTGTQLLVPSANSYNTLDTVSLSVPISFGSGAVLNSVNLNNLSNISTTGGAVILDGNWTNNGSIAVANGTLILKGSSPGLGTMSASGSFLNLWGSYTRAELLPVLTNAKPSLNAGGSIDNTGGTLNISKWAFYGGTVTGGTLSGSTTANVTVSGSDDPANTTFNAITLAAPMLVTNFVSAVFQNNLVLSNSIITVGAVPFGGAGVVFDGTQTLSGSGTILLAGDDGETGDLRQTSGTLTIASGVTVKSGATGGSVGSSNSTLVNQGTIWSATAGGELNINGGTFTNQALLVTSNGTMAVTPTNFTNLSNNTLTGGIYNVSSPGVLSFGAATFTTNAATVSLSGTASIFTAINPMTTNAGQFTIAGGRNFTTAGGLLNSGAIIVGSGSTLTIPAGNTLTNTGTINGSGTLSGNISNSGTLAPGNSPGILSINGALTLDPNSILNIEIAGTTRGTGYDELAVNGALTLGGTLNIVFLNGFTPSPGQIFDFFDSTSTSGSFATINLPPGTGWDTSNISSGQMTFLPESGAAMAGLAIFSLLPLRHRRSRTRGRPSIHDVATAPS